MAMNERSKKRLATCHPDLIKIITEVAKEEDLQVIEGHRTLERQKELMKEGKSKLKDAENGKHTKSPSLAVDIAPLKNKTIDWNDIEGFTALADKVIAKAIELNVKITWGGNWKKFKDYPHFELS